jgi:hypothetical protein
MKKITPDYLNLQNKRLQKSKNVNGQTSKNKKVSYSVINKEKHLEYFRRIALPNLPKNKKNGKMGLELDIPEDFSISTNAEEVLQIISQLAHAHKVKKINRIHTDHSKMLNDDLAAEILLGQVVSYAKASRVKNGGNLIISGKYPDNTAQIRLLNSIGIVKEVKADNQKEEEEETEKIKIYKLCGILHEQVSLHTSDQKGRAIAGFTDHINACLDVIDRELTELAGQELGEYIGEVIGNAEDHSGTPYWHIYGYLDHTDKDKIYSEVVIYCLGKSIYQTFREKKDNAVVFSQVEPYIKLHKKSFSESVLVTVKALQQFVSSLTHLNPTRGQGTIDLLNFFHTMSNECIDEKNKNLSRLTIISGDVLIEIDGTYLPKEDPITEKECIYFNDNNTPLEPPDKKYVKQMKGISFPGTIIAVKFPLRDSSLS